MTLDEYASELNTELADMNDNYDSRIPRSVVKTEAQFFWEFGYSIDDAVNEITQRAQSE